MAIIRRKNKHILTNVVIVVAYYFPTRKNHVMTDEIFIVNKKLRTHVFCIKKVSKVVKFA